MKAVFVWVPKCAGSSIAAVCREQGILVDPVNVAELRHAHYVNAEDHPDHFRFAFVRNPWDRVVSAWRMFSTTRRPPDLEPPTLQGFVEILATEPLRKRPREAELWQSRRRAAQASAEEMAAAYRCTMKNHATTVLDPFYKVFDAAGEPAVDFVGRFEHLGRDFAEVCRRLGLGRVRLPHVNRTRRRAYAKYYDPATRARVAELFAREIEYFDYAFE